MDVDVNVIAVCCHIFRHKKQYLWLVLQLRHGVESGCLNCDAICHGKTPDQMVGIISSKEICIYSVCSYFYLDVRNCI